AEADRADLEERGLGRRRGLGRQPARARLDARRKPGRGKAGAVTARRKARRKATACTHRAGCFRSLSQHPPAVVLVLDAEDPGLAETGAAGDERGAEAEAALDDDPPRGP